MNDRHWIARGIARALLARFRENGDFSAEGLLAQASMALNGNPPWLKRLIRPLAKLSLPTWQNFTVDTLSERLMKDARFDEAFRQVESPRIRQLFMHRATMGLRPFALQDCELPAITDDVMLAEFLKVSTEQLHWLAPELPLERLPGAGHYRYRLIPKASGGLRLLEMPKARMKAAQRQLLDKLLNRIPLHEAAHGFCAGRSVISHALMHSGQDVVIRFDLKDFFTSITAARVHAIFRTLGYPEGVSKALTTICTNRTSRMIVERLLDERGVHAGAAQRLRIPHLAQGAPSSPTLANLAAFSLDLRLSGLADKFGARYSRYADDLVFSGEKHLRADFRVFAVWVKAIIESEGFILHPDKTRCMPAHQQQRITGVVVNTKTNLSREEFDHLKARLHQCVVNGVASQNSMGHPDFKAYLQGRIAWARQLNASKAQRLQRLFDQITW
ncbi:MAG: RNA-directed DNA polymerase [Burkholderiales bacterium]|nr:MAG: RNA-directed DNA polymerase [Burkholderiales bacterium]